MSTGPRPPARLGLGARLFAATALVVLAGAVTLLLVAVLVAPQVFHAHLAMALTGLTPAALAHADRAFTTAMLLSLAVAVTVAVLVALAVTWLVTRRIAGPVSGLASAAARLAAGRYDTRVPEPGLGPEFTALADSFNRMATQLAGTERVRRRLLTDLAHELRTPIASIEATIEAVTDGVLPADDTTWTVLTDQAARLDRLVADLTAVSRAEERALCIDPHPQPIGALTTRAAAAVRARYAAKGVTLAIHVAPDLPDVRVDPQRLTEAVGNLLDNALRHTPPAGTVTVTVGRARRYGTGTVYVRVSDTGDGFEPADADRLFTRFYRSDPARSRATGGCGIGLTIARALVNAHGGTVSADSPGPGRGATFTITLPVHTGTPSESPAAAGRTCPV